MKKTYEYTVKKESDGKARITKRQVETKDIIMSIPEIKAYVANLEKLKLNVALETQKRLDDIEEKIAQANEQIIEAKSLGVLDLEDVEDA